MAQAGSSHRRDSAWSDVLEICKKGFANKMSSMAQEILTEVRSELEQSSDSLRKHVADLLERREKDSGEKLANLNDKMNEVLNVARCGYVDFSPIFEEIRTTEALASEASSKMTQHLEENSVLVSGALEKISSKTEVKLQGLMDRVNASEEKFERVADNLASRMTELNTEFVNKAYESRDNLDQLTASLSDQLGKIANKPLPIDDEEFRRQMHDVKRLVNADRSIVLSEIGKIQRALHLDFFQVINEAFNEPPPQAKAIEAANNTFSAKPGPDKNESTIPEEAGAKKTRVRVRDFYTQTESVSEESKWTQTDQKITERKEKKGPERPKKAEEPRKNRGFKEAEDLKKKARQHLMKPQYNVFDQYHYTGFFQRLAKNSFFENLTLGIVCLNAIWMAVDTDLNKATLITDADPLFVVVENMFCTYFFCEVSIRFWAFRSKVWAFQDGWFLFDFVLVGLMVLDTWIVPIIVHGFNVDFTGLVDLSMLRMLRMMKMTRLSRLAKLLRAVPELTIILKGFRCAARSVSVFVVFWLSVIFVFAIGLRQLASNGLMTAEVSALYFASVPETINVLLLNGILPEHQEFIETVSRSNPVMWPIVVLFFLVVSVTFLYMLVGVLVDGVGEVATSEKDGLAVSYLASELRDKMEQLHYNHDAPLTQCELQKLLLEPEITTILGGVGVDVVALIESLDMIYEDMARVGQDTLDFESILEILLSLRGGNQASVKDVKEQIRITKALVKGCQSEILQTLSSEFMTIHAELQSLRDEALARDGADAGSQMPGDRYSHTDASDHDHDTD